MHIAKNLEININKKVKFMLDLPIRIKCILTDGVILERLVQTLKNKVQKVCS